MRPLTDEELTDAEDLAREWGYDELSESWGPMVGWAAGTLYDGSDDDEWDDDD